MRALKHISNIVPHKRQYEEKRGKHKPEFVIYISAQDINGSVLVCPYMRMSGNFNRIRTRTREYESSNVQPVHSGCSRTNRKIHKSLTNARNHQNWYHHSKHYREKAPVKLELYFYDRKRFRTAAVIYILGDHPDGLEVELRGIGPRFEFCEVQRRMRRSVGAVRPLI